MKALLQWTSIVPVLAWILYFTGLVHNRGVFQIAGGILLILSVMAAVHFSETIALRVGEPFGTIILAVAITIIEVSIIVSLMATGGKDSASLARDTVFSAVILILNGIIGLSIFLGALKFHEQNFSKTSATIALVSLVSIVTLTLIFPSYSTSVKGPYYSTAQLIFVSIACLIIYSFFLLAQTSRHRNYFLSVDEQDNGDSVKISNGLMAFSLLFLLVSLGIVVLMAKTLTPAIEQIIVTNNLPKSLVGVIIAGVILLPEGAAAVIAARNNKIQVSLNLALGSALASIGLTIPCVAIVSYLYDMKIILGLDIKSMILLALSVFIVLLSLSGSKTNIVYGVVLLVNLVAYIFLIIHP
jgi:Ca2+:H+ antiporter